jgi:hypothetical protein
MMAELVATGMAYRVRGRRASIARVTALATTTGSTARRYAAATFARNRPAMSA